MNIKRQLAADYRHAKACRLQATLSGFYAFAYSLHNEMKSIRSRWAQLKGIRL